MSGYNAKDGTFDLTHTKGLYWFRRTDVPRELTVNKDGTPSSKWGIIKRVLIWQGLDVLKTTRGYLVVKATPGQVWSALSGQPDDGRSPDAEGS